MATHFVQLSLVQSAVSLELSPAKRKQRGRDFMVPSSEMDGRQGREGRLSHGRSPRVGDTRKTRVRKELGQGRVTTTRPPLLFETETETAYSKTVLLNFLSPPPAGPHF